MCALSQDLEDGGLSGASAQKRARERCWGCTTGRVAAVIASNMHRLIILAVIVTLLVLVSLKVQHSKLYILWLDGSNSIS